MQIYHVETQEDYDALMVELEGKGYNVMPIKGNRFFAMQRTCVIPFDGLPARVVSLDFASEQFPNVAIEKYKAKQNGYRFEPYDSSEWKRKKEELLERDNDLVNSPNHYTQGEYEVIDILEDKLTSDEYMGFLKGNVTKYNFRELYKNQDEDIAKAEFYQKKMKEFVAKGKTIYSRIAKRFTKVTGYEFDNEFIKQLESGELKIVRTDDGSQVNDPTGDIY